ncbi:MAG: hypothetical protein IKO53_05005 [Lachnospiraceae bacterium]|nr:hypothetical protein [Lachnospiraceae bacterium]
MAINIINGYTGEEHVYGYDWAVLNRGIFGKGNYVLGSNAEQRGALQCVINGNTVSVSFADGIGALMFSGVLAVINGSCTMSITSRNAERTDTIAAVYNKTNEGVESIELELFENTEPNTFAPLDSIDTDTLQAYFPLFTISGATTSALTITPLFKTVKVITSEENGGKTTVKYETPTGAEYEHRIIEETAPGGSQFAKSVTDARSGKNIWRYYDLAAAPYLELGAAGLPVNVAGALNVAGNAAFSNTVNFNGIFNGSRGYMSANIYFRYGGHTTSIYTGQEGSNVYLGVWDSTNSHGVATYTVDGTNKVINLGNGSVKTKVCGVFQDLNGNNLIKNVFTATPHAKTTLSGTSDTKITLEKLNSVGTNLTLSNGGIKVGNNITKVLVSGVVWIDAYAGVKEARIFKNTASCAYTMSKLPSTEKASLVISPRIVSVSPGDVFYLHIQGVKNDVVSASSTASYLTVEAIG